MFLHKLCFYQRLSISIAIVFVLILLGSLLVTAKWQTQVNNQAQQQLHIDLAEHLVHDNPILSEGVYDYAGLENLFHTLMVLGPNFEFYLLDTAGNLITYSAKPGEVVRESVDLTPINQMLSADRQLPLLGDDPRDYTGEKVFSVAEVHSSNGLQGYLYVIIGAQKYESIMLQLKQDHELQQLGLILLAGLGILMVCLLVLFKFFTMPLKSLSDDMEAVCETGFKNLADHQQPPRPRQSRNEVARLGNAFNDMLNHISGQFAEQERWHRERRMLLADLSHDLRTPLANLLGYLETLSLKHNDLSREVCEDYMATSLKNAKNLKKLIDQLFELAYLEGGQVTLTEEAIPVTELLFDIAHKFEMKAEKKRITLKVEPLDSEFFVVTDVEKLERVLSNLVDNAIRHTADGGQVSLSLQQTHGDVTLFVTDNGVGISEHELAYIFDARYQASNRQADNALHAGLGLAICKKLSLLLNGELSVESQLGEGTAFSLTLPIQS